MIPHTAGFHQQYLRNYYDDLKLELKCIVACVNVSSGYPVLAYGFKTSKA